MLIVIVIVLGVHEVYAAAAVCILLGGLFASRTLMLIIIGRSNLKEGGSILTSINN